MNIYEKLYKAVGDDYYISVFKMSLFDSYYIENGEEQELDLEDYSPTEYTKTLRVDGANYSNSLESFDEDYDELADNLKEYVTEIRDGRRTFYSENPLLFNYDLTNIEQLEIKRVDFNSYKKYIDELSDYAKNSDIIRDYCFHIYERQITSYHVSKEGKTKECNRYFLFYELEFLFEKDDIYKSYNFRNSVTDVNPFNPLTIFQKVTEEFNHLCALTDLKTGYYDVIFTNTEMAKLLYRHIIHLTGAYHYIGMYDTLKDGNYLNDITLTFKDSERKYDIISDSKFHGFLQEFATYSDMAFLDFYLEAGTSSYEDIISSFTGIVITNVENEDSFTKTYAEYTRLTCSGKYVKNGKTEYYTRFHVVFTFRELLDRFVKIGNDVSSFCPESYSANMIAYSPSVLVKNLRLQNIDTYIEFTQKEQEELL